MKLAITILVVLVGVLSSEAFRLEESVEGGSMKATLVVESSDADADVRYQALENNRSWVHVPCSSFICYQKIIFNLSSW